MATRGKFLVRIGLGTAVLVAGLAASVDARSATTAVGRFVYDAGTRTLRVPWTNAKPTVRTFTEPGSKVAFAEMHGPSGKSTYRGRPQAQNPRNNVLERILYAQNRPGVVRIAVRGQKKVRLVPIVQGKGDKGVIVFKILDWVAARTTGRRLAKVTTYDHNHVARFSLLLDSGILKLPISGPKPTWKMVQEADDLESVEVNGGKGIPAFYNGKRPQLVRVAAGKVKRVHLARNRKGVVRLSFRFRGTPELKPRLIPQGKSGKGWVLVFGDLNPKPVAVAPALAPMVVVPPVELPAPPVLAPVALPVPIAIVAAPEPPPAPPPVASPPPKQAETEFEPEYPSRIALDGRVQNLYENIPEAGAFGIDVQGMRTGSLYWRQRIAPNLATEVDLRGWETYTVRDVATAGSFHTRTEGSLRLGASRYYQLLGVTQSLYASYLVRGVTVSSTLEPIVPEFVFSKMQVFHGPVVGNAITVPVFGPLSLVGNIHAQPLTFSILDSDVDPLPVMFGLGGELGIETAYDHYVARLSYRFETLRPFGAQFEDAGSYGLAIGYRY